MDIKSIPELRFPEFESNWFMQKLSDLLTFKNGVNASKEDYGKGYKFINVLDIIQNDYITYDRIIGSVNIHQAEFEKNKVEFGDILFQRSSETREEVGQANVYLDKDLPATFGGFVIRGKKMVEYNPIFMNALLKTNRSRKEITSKSGGSTRYNVGQNTLSEVVIYTTGLEEQTKIATFLTAIDKRIHLLEKKKTDLEHYKKGVMQKLFPPKGGQAPEFRFKKEDGTHFPDWEVKKLGEVTYKVGKKNKDNVNYPIYSINNQEGFLPQSDQFNGLDSNERGFDISMYKIVSKSTFAYNPARINVGSIGYSHNLNKVIISSLYVCFKTNEELYDLYLLAYFGTHKFNNNVLRWQEGGVRQYLFYENFSQIKIPLPCSEEQSLISNFLSSIDKKIEIVAEQIEASKAFKKGLLQKMFV